VIFSPKEIEESLHHYRRFDAWIAKHDFLDSNLSFAQFHEPFHETTNTTRSGEAKTDREASGL
jgi:hypothetical protein